MDSQRPQLELLAHAGRLLLENDESTGEIHRALTTTARSLTNEPCESAFSMVVLPYRWDKRARCYCRSENFVSTWRSRRLFTRFWTRYAMASLTRRRLSPS